MSAPEDGGGDISREAGERRGGDEEGAEVNSEIRESKPTEAVAWPESSLVSGPVSQGVGLVWRGMSGQLGMKVKTGPPLRKELRCLGEGIMV